MPPVESFSAATKIKNIMVLHDGTWQTNEQPVPTNIGKIHSCIAGSVAGVPQIGIHYDGVGTGGGLDHIFGGAFGDGLADKIIGSYMLLASRYNPGDRIYIGGYSRGAFTARSLVGMINKVGLLDFAKLAERSGRLEHDIRNDSDFMRKVGERLFLIYKDDERMLEALRREEKHNNPAIKVPNVIKPSSEYAGLLRKRYAHSDGDGNVTSLIQALGVFDTVGSLGIPDHLLISVLNPNYKFHDMVVSRIVLNAYQALALDEKRSNFKPTYMEIDTDHNVTRMEQRWFPGAHGIGGGENKNAAGQLDNGLADEAGLWMIASFERHGFMFNDKKVKAAFHPNPLAQPDGKFFNPGAITSGIIRAREIPQGDPLHLASVFARVRGIGYWPESIQRSPHATQLIVDYARDQGFNIVQP